MQGGEVQQRIRDGQRPVVAAAQPDGRSGVGEGRVELSGLPTQAAQVRVVARLRCLAAGPLSVNASSNRLRVLSRSLVVQMVTASALSIEATASGRSAVRAAASAASLIARHSGSLRRIQK